MRTDHTVTSVSSLGVPQFDHFSPTRYEHALSQPIVIMLLQDATGSPAPGQIHLAPQMEISSREKCLCTVRLQGHVRSLPNNDECSAWKQELKGLRELTLTIIISLFTFFLQHLQTEMEKEKNEKVRTQQHTLNCVAGKPNSPTTCKSNRDGWGGLRDREMTTMWTWTPGRGEIRHR